MLFHFHGLRFDLPDEWADITDDLPQGSPPTLARSSGLGVIQFSIARYRKGANPNVTADDLRLLPADFFSRHSLNAGEAEETIGPVTTVGCVGIGTDETVAAWYLSNGYDIVLITYTSRGTDAHDTTAELGHVRKLLGTIDL